MKLVRSKNLVTIIAFFMLLMCASAASAENRAGAFTASPFFGKYLFDNDTDYEDDIIVGVGLGYNLTKSLAAELSYARVNTDRLNTLGEEVDGSLDLYRLEALYHLFPDSRFVPFFAVGAGLYSLDATPDPMRSGRDNDFAADYGAGFKLFLNSDIALRGDVRHVINFKGGDDDYDSNWFWSGGFTVQLGGEKKAEAKPEPVVEAAPVAPAPRDSDNDGVTDDLDKCPGTPAGVKVDQDGCPLDSDGDGVADYLDKCPDTPAGVKVDKDGCPLDSDGDGVADYLDKCPDTPAGVKVDATGCPLPEKAEVTERGTYSFGIVYFDFNKATIKPKSRPVLDNAITYMKDNPGVKLEVEGYTDSVGSNDYNRKLSDARANAVRKYMINGGIDAERLTAKGYGESNPAASNATKDGRAKNRRIEFKPIQ